MHRFSRRAGQVVAVLGGVALVCGPAARAQQSLKVRNAGGVTMQVDPDDAQPELRVMLPGHAARERVLQILFPEHVTVRRAGETEVAHLYVFTPGRLTAAPAWLRSGQTLSYRRDLAPGLTMVAKATLEPDGIRFRYEFRNDSAVRYEMIYPVTDPRMGSLLHDARLERTWVHHAGGFGLLAAGTPERLTMPLEQWLPARYHDSYTWPVPRELVEHRSDGITYYNNAERTDEPLLATVSTDGRWVVASFTGSVGNVWSNPELTCQHVDPQTSLAPGERATLAIKVLVFRGTLDEALAKERAQRAGLR